MSIGACELQIAQLFSFSTFFSGSHFSIAAWKTGFRRDYYYYCSNCEFPQIYIYGEFEATIIVLTAQDSLRTVRVVRSINCEYARQCAVGKKCSCSKLIGCYCCAIKKGAHDC
jgi:hypothetical protein